MTDDAPVLVVGSQSIHVERFVRGLSAAGVRTVVATQGEIAFGRLPGLLDATTLDLGTRSWSAPSRLRALIRRWAPAVVHVHQASSIAWYAVRAARSLGVPVVVTLWGSDVLRLHEWNWLHRWKVQHALRSADAWTADARVLLTAAERVCGPQVPVRREWIPIGIDPPPALPEVPRERRLLSCRLHKPLYRIDEILRAFAGLPETQSDWVLEVAASGGETTALQHLAQELGLGARVQFTGMLPALELARAYRRSALFVSVPESDGTSVSLLEAMEAGCLPVLSDLPANREWVQDKHTGVLVADLDGLGAALLHAMQWWESGSWDLGGRIVNEQGVADQALFADNIRQFVALYESLRSAAR
jgi:glycosyltransferase involved in cell wall biosynthesis